MRITTREQAIEDLSMFGIKEPYMYLIDIIPLIEMIWADGEAHESELAILDRAIPLAALLERAYPEPQPRDEHANVSRWRELVFLRN